MRTLIPILSIMVVIGLTASAVFAGNVHIRGEVNFGLGSLTASGTLAGLGNQDVDVTLTASGIGTATCMNKGGNEAPGQNPVFVEATGLESIPAVLFENGSTPFSVTVEDPPPPTAREAGCPNGNWRVTSFFVAWTSATITVKVAGTDVVLLLANFTCVTIPGSVTCTAVP